MKKHAMRRFLVFLFLLVAIAVACGYVCWTAPKSRQPVFGCGKEEPSKITRVHLASLSITTPLYAIDGKGKFFKINLGAEHWALISDHGFGNFSPEMVPSADGRWISYSGEVNGDTAKQYWLYDKRTGRDRLVFEHPAWGVDIPVFSPDGKMIAIAANYDSRWPNDKDAGLDIFDTETLRRTQIDLPSVISNKDAWTYVTWSQDGTELLIMRSGMSGGPDKREYFSYRPATGKAEKILGDYIEKIHEDVFLRNGREIATFPEILPHSRQGVKSEISPGGQWHAYLGTANPDSTYPLNVSAKDGSVRKIAEGHYENCIGETIWITGWIDDRHLIYAEGDTHFYVFDAAANTTAELFDGKETSLSFTW